LRGERVVLVQQAERGGGGIVSEDTRPRLDRDGYPADARWKSGGFWFGRRRSWGILGHRATGDTAVLGPRLLRLLAADLRRLADELERGEEEGGAGDDWSFTDPAL